MSSRSGTAPTTAPIGWDDIRLFVEVVREGSLAAAAARLKLDVSTVKRRMDRLEDDLGARLFDRMRTGTAPTELAESMLPHAEEMEICATRFMAKGAHVETEVAGTVRLTVPPGMADVFIASRLVELHARHPRLVIELDASISYADLTRREADLAIRTERPTSGDLVAVKLITTESVPMTSPAYARALGRIKRFSDARWIAWGPELAHLPDAAWIRAHGPDVVPVLATSHFGSQLAAARSGLGVVVAPRPFLATGLCEVRPSKQLDGAWAALPSGTLWLVGHRALRHVPRVAAAWDFVLQCIAPQA